MNDKFGATTLPCYTHEQVIEINQKIKKKLLKKQDPSYAASNVSRIGEFFHIPCLELIEFLHPWLHECQHVNRDIYGYDIDWFFHLDRMSYNVYGTGGEYGWHIDASIKNVPIDVKLTCLLNLSEEPYEGGEFYMINSNKKVEFTSGMGLIINPLIAHKITPVTKGKRITLTYWATGSSWR